MNHRIEMIFPTALFHADAAAGELDAIQAECLRAVEHSEFDTREDWGRPHYISDVTFAGDVIAEHQMTVFADFIDRSVHEYCNSLNVVFRPYTRTSWISLFRPGNYGHAHTHTYADMSGAYYYQTTGTDGDFYISSPVTAAHSSFCYANETTMAIAPQVGHLMLFPGWLTHGIRSNRTAQDRISFSWNIYFERPQFGKS
jgi:uncharacterized protein (TIGR02466 family)